MAALAAGLGAIAPIIGLVGTGISVVGTIASGNAARADAEAQARLLELRGKQEFAAGTREGQEIDRQRQLVLSRLRSQAAGSGLGGQDQTVQQLAAEIIGYGDFLKRGAIAGGRARQVSAEFSAQSAMTTGRAQQVGSYLTAGSTLLGGFSKTLAEKYGGTLRPR
jgi:hypothetical protein